jgi:hypothetical protein
MIVGLRIRCSIKHENLSVKLRFGGGNVPVPQSRRQWNTSNSTHRTSSAWKTRALSASSRRETLIRARHAIVRSEAFSQFLPEVKCGELERGVDHECLSDETKLKDNQYEIVEVRSSFVFEMWLSTQRVNGSETGRRV